MLLTMLSVISYFVVVDYHNALLFSIKSLHYMLLLKMVTVQ